MTLIPTSEIVFETSMGSNFSPSAKKKQAAYSAQSKTKGCDTDRMETHPHEDFAKRLNGLIGELDLGRGKKTLKRLSILFDCSTTTVHEWRKGKKLPSMDSAIAISLALGCCVEYLLTGRGPKRPNSTDEDGDDGDGTHLDISDLPHQEQVTLRALVYAIQEQNAEYEKKVNSA